MKTIVLFAALTLSVNMAMAGAGGGKVQENNPLYDVNGEVIGIEIECNEKEEAVSVPKGQSLYVICIPSND